MVWEPAACLAELARLPQSFIGCMIRFNH